MLLNLFNILKYFHTEKSFVKVKTKIMQKKFPFRLQAGHIPPSLYRQIEDENWKTLFPSLLQSRPTHSNEK